MKRVTSYLLAAALAVAGGRLVFQSFTASSSTFNGSISSTPPSPASNGGMGNASLDLIGNGLVLMNEAADGGAATNAIVINQDGCIKWPGTSASVCMSNNTLSLNTSDLITSTRHFMADSCPAGTSCYLYADPGQWWYLVPQAGVTGCTAGREGGLRANATDHHPYYCNGTEALKLSFSVSHQMSIDFPDTPAMTTSEVTASFAGAEVGDVVTCRAIGDTPEGWIIRQTYVSSVDEVTIDGFYAALSGSLNPTAQDYECVAIR